MNVLEKILEEIEDRKSYHEELLSQRDDYEIQKMYCDEELNWIRDIIRSHMGEASDMHGKRLIDANALDEEVRNFFLTIIGDPSQSTVVRECKESFRKMIDEQPTVHVIKE